MKTVTLELGGKNPIVVFPDADIDEAIEGALRGMAFTWQGQSCGSTSRLLLHEDIHDDFVAALSERIESLRPGPPLSPESDTGAIVNDAQMQKVLRYIQIGRDGAAPGGRRRARHRRRSRAGSVRAPGAVHRRPPGRAARAGGDLRPVARRHAVLDLRRGADESRTASATA